MRSKRAQVRPTLPDAKYGSVKVTKLINRSMKDGKKSVAAKQVYTALDTLATKTNQKVADLIEEVYKKATPMMEVRSRRVGGAAYQVPMPIKPRRGVSLVTRWIIEEANKRSSKEYHTFADKLAAEMLDILQGAGGVINKKESSHRMAESNKAFAHFRW